MRESSFANSRWNPFRSCAMRALDVTRGPLTGPHHGDTTDTGNECRAVGRIGIDED